MRQPRPGWIVLMVGVGLSWPQPAPSQTAGPGAKGPVVESAAKARKPSPGTAPSPSPPVESVVPVVDQVVPKVPGDPFRWKVTAGADGDGAWFVLLGYPDDPSALPASLQGDPVCHWTIAMGGRRFEVATASIYDEGFCPMYTKRALKSAPYRPGAPITASVEVRSPTGALLAVAGPKRFEWNPADLVSTEGLRRALEAKGWRYRGADVNGELSDYALSFGTYIGPKLQCGVETAVGVMADQPVRVPDEPAYVIRGPNHEIVLFCQPRPGEVEAEKQARAELLSIIKTAIRGQVRETDPKAPAE